MNERLKVKGTGRLYKLYNKFAARVEELIVAAPKFRSLVQLDNALVYIATFKADMDILGALAVSKKMQDAANSLKEKAAKLETRLLQVAHVANPKSEEGKRFLIMKQLAGGDLDAKGRKEVTRMLARYSAIVTEFEQNVAADHRKIGFPDYKDFSLAEEYLNGNAVLGDDQLWVTTRINSYMPFMTFCTDSPALEKMFYERSILGWAANKALIHEARVLGTKIALMLGFNTAADWQLALTSVKNSAGMTEFQTQVLDALKAPAAEQMQHFADLLGYKPERWHQFLVESKAAAEIGFNEEQAMKYLSWSNALKAVLNTTEELFGVSYEAITVDLWVKGLKGYKVNVGGKFVGTIITDPFVREGKFDGFANFPTFDSKGKPVAIVGGNWDEGDILPSDTVTLFHEWGHALAHLLAKGKYTSLGYSNDGSEVPSTFMEAAAFRPTAAQFYKNAAGEAMPQDMLEAYARTRKGKAVDRLHQLFLGKLMLSLYERDGEPLELFAEIWKEVQPYDYHEGIVAMGSIVHIVAEGYGAGYSIYLIAEMLAANLWQAADVANWDAAFGETMLRELFEVGGARHIYQTVAAITGKPVSFQAFAEAIAQPAVIPAHIEIG